MTHYYSETQTSKLKLKKLRVNLRNFSFEIYTASGMFSPKRIDKGTVILIDNMVIKGKTLDLGCGYGIIGLVASKLTKEDVYLTDINKRACQIAELNLKINNIRNAKVIQGNLYEPLKNIKFDTILINPPQTAGKEICLDMVKHAKEHLNKNGLLELVARHNKGGKYLSEYMEQIFGNLKVITKKTGYRIYLSENET
mgnify:FL=1